MISPNVLISSLKQAGMRITPQRVAICKLLAENETHPTAATIYEQIRLQYPSLSLMTVYNTLNSLVELGVINELGQVGDDKIHYDVDSSPHINLACISCHKIMDVPFPQIHNFDMELSAVSGYKLLGTRLMYYGLCPECQLQSGSV